eukprot:GEMP01052593.1.p1 GENE.GEMP01052593.1~~GEMP01052593.1.p1  ORF type:complete len:168 (+),score=17.72 GEMP01052593.1:345-848(+)
MCNSDSVPAEWIQRAWCPIRPLPKPTQRIPKPWLERVNFENSLADHHRQLCVQKLTAEEDRAQLRKRWRKQALRCHIEHCMHRIEVNGLRHFGSCIDGTDQTANIILEAKIASREQLFSLHPPRAPASPMLSPAGSINGFSAFGLRCEAQIQIEISNRLLRACPTTT